VAGRFQLFFDFDDTLSDFRTLGVQYIENLAVLLSSEMGGPRDTWRAAIPPALQASVDRYLAEFQVRPLAGYNAWLDAEREQVIRDVFLRMGIDGPTGAAARELAVMLQDRGLRGCNALFEQADPTLRDLSRAGFPLHFASSQESAYLRAAMTGAPSFHHFREFFGPDLIDCAKEGPEYYERVFKAVGIEPNQAVVIDDQPVCLQWASELGARVIQARTREDPDSVAFEHAFEKFEDLTSIMENLVTGTTASER
jgi:phosphoglycolate phosphatase-like HAD superfamily hydrolase